MEPDDTPGQRKGYRICLNIPFLEKMFSIRICDNNNLEAVAAQLNSTNVQEMKYDECTNEFIASHMTLKPENSVLMKLVRKAMECDVLEKAPIERRGTEPHPNITRYPTPLHPEPILLSNANSTRGQLVLLHATGRNLQMKRTDKPMSKIMMTDFGQPTSERNLKRARESERIQDVRPELLRHAATITSSLADPDYTASKEMILTLGLPVNPLVRKAYGDEIAMDPKIFLPMGFTPVDYYVSRWLSHITQADTRFIQYPLANVRQKIDGAQKRLLGADSNEISPDHVDIELMSGIATIGGITFSVPAITRQAWDKYREDMDHAADALMSHRFDWFYNPDPVVPVNPNMSFDEDVPDAMDVS
jgi:hypothetical protein